MVLETRIVEQLPIGVTLTTFEGRLLNANPEAYRLLQIDPTIRGMNVCDLYADPSERAAMVDDVMADVRKRHEVRLLVNGEPVLFRSMNVAFEQSDHGNGVILSAFWRV